MTLVEILNVITGALGILYGIGSVVIAILSIRLSKGWSKQTNELIKTEDARAKQIIEDGHKRAEMISTETRQIIDEGHKRTEIISAQTLQMIEDGHKRFEVIMTKMEENAMRSQEILEYVAGLVNRKKGGGFYAADK